LKNILDTASEAYYAGNPIMSDASFDVLASHFNYNALGSHVTNGIPHYYPLYSLQKVYEMEDAPLNSHYCVKTPKLDGAAVSALYVDGKYSLALTRGDGAKGLDITDKLQYLVPPSIRRKGIVQIAGEVVAPKDKENSRNFAAGSLNLKDIEEFKKRPLTFVLYDIRPNPYKTWTEAMDIYASIGFKTVLDSDLEQFPTDGIVFRINSMNEFKSLGYTAHHPRGAFAYKIQEKGEQTTLLDVIWQVGKSGVVSPVAILDPVLIEGAKVSKATLHNIEYINSLELEIGCQVEVIRSGKIIPRVVRRIG